MNKASLKGMVYRAARASRLLDLGRSAGRSGIVVFYHGAQPYIDDETIQDIHLPFAEFERQIKYLKENFDILSMDRFSEKLERGERINPDVALVTIDDGYRNNLLYVAPFLYRYRIPFTLFVSTHHIEKARRFPAYYAKTAFKFCDRKVVQLKRTGLSYDLSSKTSRHAAILDVSRRVKYSRHDVTMNLVEDLKDVLSPDRWKELDERFSSEQPLTWSEVREIQSLGGTIGSHCHDHVLLHEGQTAQETERQLKLSRDLIIQNTGRCDYFCYPNGGADDISSLSVSLLPQLNYRLGFSSIEGQCRSSTNRYILPRLGARHFDSFAALVNLGWKFNRTFDAWEKRLLPRPSGSR